MIQTRHGLKGAIDHACLSHRARRLLNPLLPKVFLKTVLTTDILSYTTHSDTLLFSALGIFIFCPIASHFLQILAFRNKLLPLLGPTNPWNHLPMKPPLTHHSPSNTHTHTHPGSHKQNQFDFPYLKAPCQELLAQRNRI